MIALRPLSHTQRDGTLDLLRGFALAGVLFMFCVHDIGTSQNYKATLLDEIIAWPKWILVENRMYTMLILIFGIGFHVQLKKAEAKGASLLPFFLRRILGLLVIGFIHAVLLSKRDILMFYGFAGLALLPVRHLSNRQLLFVIAFVFMLLVTPFLSKIFGYDWVKAKMLTQPNNYLDHISYNWQYFLYIHLAYNIYLDMLFHFLLGFWISRIGFLEKLKANHSFRKKLLIISVIATIILIPVYYFWIDPVVSGWVYAIKSAPAKFLASSLIRIIWQVWMMVSVTLYVILLIQFSSWRTWNKKWQYSLAAFGQMALSNYLIQSILLVPVLLLFDRFNNIPPFTGFLMFILVLVLQLRFSTWWLSRFSMGPFEWLLRSFTYMRWQPIRRYQKDELLATISNR